MKNKLHEDILRLKKEKNAIILAHLYESPEIQEIADYVGDSYYLSEVGAQCKEETIVFCGVRFMAESAKILSPNKKVYLPVNNAGCKMADMATPKELQEKIQKYPDAFKVCYINSSYEVKALCDVSVTSSSALKIMKNIPNEKILFLPDKNLGSYISEFFPEKSFIYWDGCCPVHNDIKLTDIIKQKEIHPNVKVLSHPECTKEVRDISDYVGSTSGIIEYATNSDDLEFIICTEEGILHQLQKKNPHKKFYFPRKIYCSDMKKIKLEDVYNTLMGNVEEIILDEKISKQALVSLENMHKLANNKELVDYDKQKC